MKRILRLTALGAALATIGGTWAFGQIDPNPAANQPDKTAWQLFAQVNANAGGGNVVFETWASDTDTFKPGSIFPTSPTPLSLHLPALVLLERMQAQKLHKAMPALPPGVANGVLEETRRNHPAWNFIVNHELNGKPSPLNSVSGLQANFGQTLSFPIDSIEVKANWVAVSNIAKVTTYRGPVSDVSKHFHTHVGPDQVQYALLSMHVISKLVPNWTWATFESQYNPARCDFSGCTDNFGASPAFTPPNSQQRQGYGNCQKTPDLAKIIAEAKLDPAFNNYCLKGTQLDFTDSTGLGNRLGNSVTEPDPEHSSCMTCHSMAGWNAQGQENNFSFVFGPPDPSLFWKVVTPIPSTVSYPIVAPKSTLVRIATPADFVWSVPFCAYDDVTDPKHPRPTSCGGK